MKTKGCASLLPVLLLAITLAASVFPATAQEIGDTVEAIPEVDQVFDQALAAFEEGDYGMAYRRFRLVYSGYPLNTKTTAALLMGGKSLYRQDRFEDAITLLEEFVRDYPTSSYVSEAERTIAAARERVIHANAAPAVVNLGIALPLTDVDDALTQAMFNGVRLAVDAHNDRYGAELPVRMVFRDTDGSAAGAREAAGSLVEAGAAAIIGPLYSQEAEAAAEVADRSGVVLIAPLATEETVSAAKRHVFQANPTWTARGEMLARFAMERFGHERFGVFAELGDSYSERMAEGFQEEITRLGGNVLHYRLIEQASDWYNLDQLIPATSWDSLQAVYLPISGADADQLASGVLSALSRAGVTTQVFGSSEWGEVTALSLASDYNTVYTTTYHLLAGDPAVEQFRDAYRDLAGTPPSGETGRVAFAGYDVTRFLLLRMTQAGDEPLVASISNAPWYQGISSRIFFEGGNVNRGLFYMRYRPGKVDLLR